MTGAPNLTAGRRADALTRADLWVFVALWGAAFVLAWVGHGRLAPEILSPATFDYWFDSDTPDVKLAMLDRAAAQHWRAQRHPLSPVAMHAPVFVLRQWLGVSTAAAIAATTAAFAGTLVAAFYGFLRVSGLRILDALVFTCVLVSSAAMVFWAPVPELFIPAAVSLIPALAVAGRSARGQQPSLFVCTLAAAATLAFSTNQWAVGLLMLLVLLPLPRVAVAGAGSLGLVYALWRVQRVGYPRIPPFLASPRVLDHYLFNPIGLGPVARSSSALFHSMVMPPPFELFGGHLSVQGVLPFTGGFLSVVATGLWIALLGFGAWAALRGTARRLSAVAGLGALSQVAFCIAFGIETFLYAGEFAPLLVAFVAPAALTSRRRPVLAVALLFALTAGIGNVLRFESAAQDLHARFEREHAFAADVAALTDADVPVVYGGGPAAAEGMAEPPAPPNGPARPLWHLGLFPDVASSRKGWFLHQDHWSIERIESFRAEGAAYFVSSNAWALERSAPLLAELQARYELVHGGPGGVIYALHPER